MPEGGGVPKKKAGCWVWGLGIFGGLVVLGMLVPDQKPNPALAPQAQGLASSPAASAAAPANGPEITAEEFGQLKPGMTLAAAQAIVGSAGEVQSESEIAGYHTVMVSWQGEGLGNANAMFQNGKLINKAQFGL